MGVSSDSHHKRTMSPTDIVRRLQRVATMQRIEGTCLRYRVPGIPLSLPHSQVFRRGPMKLPNYSTASDLTKVWHVRSAVTALCLFMACLFLVVEPSHAQRETGTINGTVADSQGAVIPNASVSLVNVASGDKRETVSNGTGFFSITAIPPVLTRSRLAP